MMRLSLVTIWATVMAASLMAAQTTPAPVPAGGGTVSGKINGVIDGTIGGTGAQTPSQATRGPGGPQTAPVEVPGLGSGGYRMVSPLVQPTLSPGALELLELEGKFSEAVGTGGGKAFVEWFADDAVVLNNGKPALLGRGAISGQAQWDPKLYKLTWVAQGAQMGPSNDMGFTWGHYEGRSTDAKGEAVVTSGRYITVWKKVRGGGWKVAMDASSNEPAASGDCCTLPKP